MTTEIVASPPSGARLYVDPDSQAMRWATENAKSRPVEAKLILEKIANQPQAMWFGGWNADVQADISSAVRTAARAAATPILVAYNIPQRDCGSYSAGGSGSAQAYQAWIRSFANGIAGLPAIVILEPDALAAIECLRAEDQQQRLALLSYAVEIFARLPRSKVYIDAGHSRWPQHQGPADQVIAQRLVAANVAKTAGFSLNVSNFIKTEELEEFGSRVSKNVSKKIGIAPHFVVDTSRNGEGPLEGGPGQEPWCNPPGRALGNQPTLLTGRGVIDGYLWIKRPGESDGDCKRGEPAAGAFFPEYAVDLAQRAKW